MIDHPTTTPENMNNRETLQRLPELTLIEDSHIRNETIDIIQNHCPDYFWDVPAATRYGYHHPACCDVHGLWIHTKMVFTVFERQAESPYTQGLMTSEELDYGRSATLLHDMRKHGRHHQQGQSAEKDHDLQMAEIIREHSDLPDEVADAVSTHMGPKEWGYEGPEPDPTNSLLNYMVHMADMAGASKNITPGIYEPHPEIRSKYPSIPRAEFE